MPRPRKKSTRIPLSRTRIVRAALDITDKEGPDALSMRRLGAELGVDPMALYHHLPGKDALLDGIVEAVMTEIDLASVDPSLPTEERVVRATRAYRGALLAHVRALPIVLTRTPRTPPALRPVEHLLAILREAGLPPAQALAGTSIIAAAMRGSLAPDGGISAERFSLLLAAASLPPDEFPHLHEAARAGVKLQAQDFEYGIRAVVRGLLAGIGSAPQARKR